MDVNEAPGMAAADEGLSGYPDESGAESWAGPDEGSQFAGEAASYPEPVRGEAHYEPASNFREGFLRHARMTQAPQGAEHQALASLEGQLARFRAVDWQAAARENPQAAKAALDRFAQAVEQREALAGSLAAHEETMVLERGHAELSRDIPDWSPQVADRLTQFAQSQFGFTPQELDQVTDPRLVKLLHQAWSGAAGQAQAARIRAGQATAPAMTLRSGRGRSDVSADTDDFSAFEKMADARLRAR